MYLGAEGHQYVDLLKVFTCTWKKVFLKSREVTLVRKCHDSFTNWKCKVEVWLSFDLCFMPFTQELSNYIPRASLMVEGFCHSPVLPTICSLLPTCQVWLKGKAIWAWLVLTANSWNWRLLGDYCTWQWNVITSCQAGWRANSQCCLFSNGDRHSVICSIMLRGCQFPSSIIMVQTKLEISSDLLSCHQRATTCRSYVICKLIVPLLLSS